MLKAFRNAIPASLTGTSGSGCQAVRGITVVMTADGAGGEPFPGEAGEGPQMPVMAPGVL